MVMGSFAGALFGLVRAFGLGMPAISGDSGDPGTGGVLVPGLRGHVCCVAAGRRSLRGDVCRVRPAASRRPRRTGPRGPRPGSVEWSTISAKTDLGHPPIGPRASETSRGPAFASFREPVKATCSVRLVAVGGSGPDDRQRREHRREVLGRSPTAKASPWQTVSVRPGADDAAAGADAAGAGRGGEEVDLQLGGQDLASGRRGGRRRMAAGGADDCDQRACVDVAVLLGSARRRRAAGSRRRRG